MAAALAALAASSAALALDIAPVFRMGGDLGGDQVLNVTFSDGSTRHLRANQGLSIGGGASLVNEAGNLELEVALSYKFATVDESDELTFTRWPLDALVFYRWEHVRVGAGLTYHINPKVSASDATNNVEGKFNNALGVLLQVDWRIDDKNSLGLRYTALEYEAKAPLVGTVKSNGVGIAFSTRF